MTTITAYITISIHGQGYIFPFCFVFLCSHVSLISVFSIILSLSELCLYYICVCKIPSAALGSVGVIRWRGCNGGQDAMGGCH